MTWSIAMFTGTPVPGFGRAKTLSHAIPAAASAVAGRLGLAVGQSFPKAVWMHSGLQAQRNTFVD